MKHITAITVAKADASKNMWDDISTWFEDLWGEISDWFNKGDD